MSDFTCDNICEDCPLNGRAIASEFSESDELIPDCVSLVCGRPLTAAEMEFGEQLEAEMIAKYGTDTELWR